MPYTIEAWVKLSAAGSVQSVVWYGETNEENSLFLSRYTTSASINSFWTNPWFESWFSIDPVDPVGNWVHYATTFDGTESVNYVDGMPLATNDSRPTYMTASADNLGIGVRINGANLLNGLIDDVKIYNYARTGTEIAAAVYAGNGNNPVCMENNEMDFDGDCDIDLVDFADFAAEWLKDIKYDG